MQDRGIWLGVPLVVRRLDVVGLTALAGAVSMLIGSRSMLLVSVALSSLVGVGLMLSEPALMLREKGVALTVLESSAALATPGHLLVVLRKRALALRRALYSAWVRWTVRPSLSVGRTGH